MRKLVAGERQNETEYPDEPRVQKIDRQRVASHARKARSWSSWHHHEKPHNPCTGGSVQDESGIYAGLTWHPSRKWNISAYSDFAYFLSPSDDFIAEILRKRDRLYVVAPAELRQKVARYVKEMGKNYEEQKKV